MADIFISYERSDYTRAQRIAEALWTARLVGLVGSDASRRRPL